MNLEKFTERSRGFLQAAQTIAMRENHQRLAPEHLLKALMDDDQGLSANLIRRAGGEPARVAEGVEAAIDKLPKVSGDTGQVYMDPKLGQVLDEAEKIATELHKRVQVGGREGGGGRKGVLMRISYVNCRSWRNNSSSKILK